MSRVPARLLPIRKAATRRDGSEMGACPRGPYVANYHKSSKGQLPAILTPYVVRSMYRPLRYSNAALKQLGLAATRGDARGAAPHVRVLARRRGLTHMRLMHVVDSLELGGLERIVTDLAIAQRDRGHDVSVFSLLDTQDSPASCAPPGSSLHRRQEPAIRSCTAGRHAPYGRAQTDRRAARAQLRAQLPRRRGDARPAWRAGDGSGAPATTWASACRNESCAGCTSGRCVARRASRWSAGRCTTPLCSAGSRAQGKRRRC